jgi:cupin 2 domain-containing protein
MPLAIANLLTLPFPLPREEQFELLVAGPDLRVERIISTGQTTPAGEWYDQAQDEWVVLLQGEAELRFADEQRYCLKTGDSVLIPAHCRHRVESTSTEPPCIWLAVHGKFGATSKNEVQ